MGRHWTHTGFPAYPGVDANFFEAGVVSSPAIHSWDDASHTDFLFPTASASKTQSTSAATSFLLARRSLILRCPKEVVSSGSQDSQTRSCTSSPNIPQHRAGHSASSFFCAQVGRSAMQGAPSCCSIGSNSLCTYGFGECPPGVVHVSKTDQVAHPRTYCGRLPNHVAICTITVKEDKDKSKSIEELQRSQCKEGFKAFTDTYKELLLKEKLFAKDNKGLTAVCCHRSDGFPVSGITCDVRMLEPESEKLTKRFAEGVKSQVKNPCGHGLHYKISQKMQDIAEHLGKNKVLATETGGISRLISTFVIKLLDLVDYYVDKDFLSNPRAYSSMSGKGPAASKGSFTDAGGAALGGLDKELKDNTQVRAVTNTVINKCLPEAGAKVPIKVADLMQVGGSSSEAKAARARVLKGFPLTFKFCFLREMKDRLEAASPLDGLHVPSAISGPLKMMQQGSAKVLYDSLDKLLSFENAMKLKCLVTKKANENPNCEETPFIDEPPMKRVFKYMKSKLEHA